MAALGEQELGRATGPGMAHRALAPPIGGPGVENRDGRRIERHDPLGRELAERHPEPAAGGRIVDDRVELEVEALAQPQSGPPQERDRGPRERVGGTVHGGCQRPIDIRGEGPGTDRATEHDPGHRPSGRPRSSSSRSGPTWPASARPVSSHRGRGCARATTRVGVQRSGKTRRGNPWLRSARPAGLTRLLE